MARSLRAALAALLGLLPALAFAQPDDSGDRLPSLTPRVFESRGTIAVSLPDIERQPLSGFGPPPRTYVVPEDRQPVEQPFAPDLRTIPLLVLAPPAEPDPDDRLARRFRAEGGAGAYVSRYGRLDASGIGAAGEFYVDADYDGIGETSRRVAFDRLHVRAGGRSFSPGRIRLEAFGLIDGYTTPAEFNDARRVRRSAGVEAGVEGLGAVRYALSGTYQQSSLGRADDSEPESTEGRIDIEGRLGFLGNRVRLDAAGGAAGSGGLGTDVRYGAGGMAIVFGQEGGLRVAVGARALTLDVDGAAASADAQTAGPILDLSVPFGAGRLFVQNDPHIAVRSLADLAGTNPFVFSDPLVFPDVLPIDARAGLELRPGAARLRAYGLAFRAPTYLVFDAAGGQFAPAVFDVTAVGAGGDAVVDLPSGISASAGVEVRIADADGSAEVPFFAPVVGHAGLQVPFAGGRGRVGLAAAAESARPLDRVGSDDAPAWGVLSLDARYDLSGPFSVVLRGERLVGEAERWPGSPEPPFTVLLGLRFSR
ncbi:MAG: hypothetical protein AAGK21_02200 [Bacteroidota bacterium]